MSEKLASFGPFLKGVNNRLNDYAPEKDRLRGFVFSPSPWKKL